MPKQTPSGANGKKTEPPITPGAGASEKPAAKKKSAARPASGSGQGTKKTASPARTGAKKPTAQGTRKPASQSAKSAQSAKKEPPTGAKKTASTTRKKSAASPAAEAPREAERPFAPAEEVRQTTSAPETPEARLPAPTPGSGVETAMPPVAFPEPAGERRHFLSALLTLLLLIAVAAVSVLIFLYRPTAYAERTDSVVFLYSEGTDTTMIVVNGSPVGEPRAGRCTASASDESGRTAAAVIGGTLYLIDGRRVTALCEQVSDFFLSQNGKAVAYRTEENVLYHCFVSKKPQPFRVSRDTRDSRYCLSPNGKELFYTYVQEESARLAVYSTTNNDPHFTTVVGLVPVAVADDCACLYYANAEDGTLYYLDPNGKTPVICYGGEEPYTLLFDRDLDEMLIDTESGTQLWKNGQRVVTPTLESKAHLQFLPNRCAVARPLPLGTQVSVTSFEKGYYLQTGTVGGGASLVYLGGKGKLTQIHFVADGTLPVVTDKGVYFLSEETHNEEGTDVRRQLYRCKRGKTEAELMIRGVTDFCVNTDGSRILYVGREQDLYALAVGAEVSQRLADEIERGSLCVTADDTFYCYVGTALYKSDNGDRLRPVRENADAVIVDAHTAYIFVWEEGGTFAVYANHRGRRGGDKRIAAGVTDLS